MGKKTLNRSQYKDEGNCYKLRSRKVCFPQKSPSQGANDSSRRRRQMPGEGAEFADEKKGAGPRRGAHREGMRNRRVLKGKGTLLEGLQRGGGGVASPSESHLCPQRSREAASAGESTPHTRSYLRREATRRTWSAHAVARAHVSRTLRQLAAAVRPSAPLHRRRPPPPPTQPRRSLGKLRSTLTTLKCALHKTRSCPPPRRSDNSAFQYVPKLKNTISLTHYILKHGLENTICE